MLKKSNRGDRRGYNSFIKAIQIQFSTYTGLNRITEPFKQDTTKVDSSN